MGKKVDRGGAGRLVASRLDDIWTDRGIDRELKKISQLTPYEQRGHGKPNSPFSISVLKIASLVKGNDNVSDVTVRNRLLGVIRYMRYFRMTDKAFDTVWRRAMDRAVPRSRDGWRARAKGS